jgi:natural product biosynthesis luciferase-like monooxygenase protein
MSAASSSRLSCVLAGTESLLIQCGELLLEKGWVIARVVSRDDGILDWARGHDLATCAPGVGLAESLRGTEFDYFFSITNLSMIPEDVINMAQRGAINFHDGPLPRYAGMYTPAWAILNGETEYGITFHEMTVGVDEGRILIQRLFPVAEDETSLTLNTSCYAAAIEGFGELTRQLAEDRLAPRAQDFSQRSYFGRHQRPEAAGLVDWTKSSLEVSRFVRAMNFGGRYSNPFCVAKLVHGGTVLRVGGALPVETESNTAPGTLIAMDDQGWTVRCGSGAVALSELGCSRGTLWTPGEAAANLGLSIGSLIGGQDEIDRGALSALHEELTPLEAYWVGRLSRLDPVEAPYRTGDGAGRVERLSVEVGGLLAGLQGAERSDSMLGGFLLYLARIQGVSSFDVTLREPSLAARVAPFGGLFSEQVPLHFEVDVESQASEALAAARKAIAKTREKGTYLVDAISRDPILSANPILASGRSTSVVCGVEDPSTVSVLPAGCDLGFFVSPSGNEAEILFDPSAIEARSANAIVKQLGILLAGFADDARSFARLPMVDEEERRRILNDWNQTSADLDRSATLRSLFEARVAQSPDETALVFEGAKLTYRELDERAGRLANHLADLGIGPDGLVGIHLARSIDMVVGVLGVLKAGGAYVPLDPVYPEDRIAYMIEDSKASVVLTHAAASPALPVITATVVDLDGDACAIAARPVERPVAECLAESLAYVIYTSGSTGQPKGVMVEHRNAVNFFVGMDERVPHDPPGTWLAVTSLSFDISVLELLWTLTRGFEVVVFEGRDRVVSGPGEIADLPWRPIDMGLALWGSDAGPGPRKYELMLESAKFADEHGFCAVHTPERHFGAFGGPFPNPSVTGAAIAAVTKNVQIRASSCVLPLHHPVRVAEEWAVVDNISNGRVGVSFASGWQPNDFVIRPEAFADAKATMFENAEVVRKLWRGEAVEFPNPHGKSVPTTTLPRPVQAELPTWITTAGNVQTFRAAGAAGLNVLTHLLGQNLQELAEKVKAYRQARVDAGHDPAGGTVTCMLHTFVGDDDAAVRKIVREPMKDYLASSMSLVMDFAWSFPAFARPGGADSKPEDVDLNSLSEDETDAILEFAFERYYETSGLFGTAEACERMLERCKAADVDEIACLIDFGVETDLVLGALEALDGVREKANERPAEAGIVGVSGGSVGADHSFAAQVERHNVTHLQCTPSHATMLLTNPETRSALRKIPNLMIGGEAFPVSLAAELDGVVQGSVTNMYGPTETTIWSSTELVCGSPESISVGTPIANTQFYVLDAGLEPLPTGVAGELWIGGEGVVRGYHERPDLTAERFVADPFSDRPGSRIYRTGDLARWTEEGRVDFLGRLDQQVKIRGYRIELGEIEAKLAGLDGVRECVVVAREDVSGDVRLVAYALAEGAGAEEKALREGLRESLPEFMVPSNILFMERFPLTPNGKVDRKAMPAPSEMEKTSEAEYVAPTNDLESQIAEVWREVLYLEQVGVHDNFFDLGGHSLLVVQAHRKLADRCPMPISLTDLYRFPTICGLAGNLSKGGDSGEAVAASQARGEKRREALGRRRRRGGRGS